MFTLSNCVDKINQALNYPSLTYYDMSLYFDQAISELNTSLHIQIEPISQLINKNRSNTEDLVLLTSKPTSATTIPISTDENPTEDYFYNPDKKMFGRKTNGSVVYSKSLNAVYNDPNEVSPCFYTSFVYSADIALWVTSKTYDPLEFDLLNILPNDWIILFLIPYVCFKQSIKDGATGALFSEEFSQGFTQLRSSYGVPEKVLLSRVAGMWIYEEDVTRHLPYLNIWVPTRAITTDMIIDKAILANYGSMYDRGGWGI